MQMIALETKALSLGGGGLRHAGSILARGSDVYKWQAGKRTATVCETTEAQSHVSSSF